MQEFMMIFRMADMGDYQPTPEEMQESVAHWQNWIGGIAAQGKFVSTSQLGFSGKTVRADGVVTDGPYAEVKEMVGGNVVVKAESLDDAVALAHGCPILAMGGHVEVRDMIALNF
jgi:hypothetical protein